MSDRPHSHEDSLPSEVPRGDSPLSPALRGTMRMPASVKSVLRFWARFGACQAPPFVAEPSCQVISYSDAAISAWTWDVQSPWGPTGPPVEGPCGGRIGAG